MTPADISVVIPTLNEQSAISDSIRSALRAGAREVIIADGGSTDDTLAVASEAGATKLVRALPGRGIQLNSGALMAERDVVLFLHADNQLADDCLKQICCHGEMTWGAFRQRIDSPKFVFRMIEFGNALRVRYLNKPFGDQAIFVRREVFKQQGGFAEIPLMEDVDFSNRLKAIAKPLLLDGPVTINARRWERYGPVRQTLRNWSIQLSYWMGVPAEKLKRRYR